MYTLAEKNKIDDECQKESTAEDPGNKIWFDKIKHMFWLSKKLFYAIVRYCTTHLTNKREQRTVPMSYGYAVERALPYLRNYSLTAWLCSTLLTKTKTTQWLKTAHHFLQAILKATATITMATAYQVHRTTLNKKPKQASWRKLVLLLESASQAGRSMLN